MNISEIGLIVGVFLGLFLGNWLIVPPFCKSRNFKEGFFVGLMSAALWAIVYIVYLWIT